MDVKLSPSEKKLYDILKRSDRRITSEELAKKFYGGEVPLNGRTVVTILLKRLKAKSKIVPGVRRVHSTEGSGPKALEVWLGPATRSAA